VPNDDHATIVHNVPNFFTYHLAFEYHLEFDDRPNLRASDSIHLHEYQGKMQTNDNLACILAIMNNRKSEVKQSCQFILMTNFIRPDIFVIDDDHVVLTNITNVTLRCFTKPDKIIDCRTMCKVTLPCRCSLLSSVGYIPQRLGKCITHQREPEVLHTVNLALLQQFFSESKLGEIWAILYLQII